MKGKIRYNIPNRLKSVFSYLYSVIIVPVDFILIKIQPWRHGRVLERKRKKRKFKVAFLVLNSDIWKYENLILYLENDIRFEPVIITCPPINEDDESMYLDMKRAYEFFSEKNHPVIMSLTDNLDTYLDIKKEISPDIVFFTNPYGYTLKKYQIKNFLDTLTCYVQYSFIMEEKEHFYNKTFHSLLWKAFYETEVHKELAVKFAKNNGKNVEVTGYPGTDSFIYDQRVENNAWKNKNAALKRIVWAPHWSVVNRGHDRPSASNFIALSQFMLEIARKYSKKIQIAFKPHPYLKNMLYKQPGWGKEQTDSYYNTWNEMGNGQLETGNYIDLFNSSDAMILDSMSFIAEYLYCGKPSLFMKSEPDVDKWFNKFGKKALEQHYHGYEKKDIIHFIDKIVLKGDDPMKEKRDLFYHEILTPPNGSTASENIYKLLCRELFS